MTKRAFEQIMAGAREALAIARGEAEPARWHVPSPVRGHSGRGKQGRLASPRPEYRAWVQMHSRCYNKNHEQFGSYGAAGIIVCERWHCYESFFADVGERRLWSHVLGLRDPTGDYKPGNAGWMTRKEFVRNRRR